MKRRSGAKFNADSSKNDPALETGALELNRRGTADSKTFKHKA
jgi:hypothetical protein